MSLEIQAIGLHWIDDEEPERDLCAHGDIRITYSGEVFASDEELALSTGAVHLLRTISHDHTPQSPLFEHLIPHCGHFMCLDPTTGDVVNIGCPSGLNWWVRTRGEVVVLALDGRTIELPHDEWKEAVASFSDSVQSFYKLSAPKQPTDDDLEWWTVFVKHWDTLRTGIANLPPN